MATNLFHSVKAIARKLVMLVVGVVVIFSLTQTVALAASSQIQTKPGAAPGITEPLPNENIDELKEQRREWQSKVSAANNEEDKSSSLGETLKEKLNLDEITEAYTSDNESVNAR